MQKLKKIFKATLMIFAVINCIALTGCGGGGGGGSSSGNSSGNSNNPGGGSVNNAPVFISVQNEYAEVGVLYSDLVGAVDYDGDQLTYRLISSPIGMTINSASGQINWTPSGPSTGSSVIVYVSDGHTTVSKTFSIKAGHSQTLASSYINQSVGDTITVSNISSSLYGLKAGIGANLLNSNRTVSIKSVTNPPYIADDIPVFRIDGIAGNINNGRINIEMPYSYSSFGNFNIDSSNETCLALFYLDQKNKIWIPVNSTINTNNKKVYGEIQFSNSSQSLANAQYAQSYGIVNDIINTTLYIALMPVTATVNMIADGIYNIGYAAGNAAVDIGVPYLFQGNDLTVPSMYPYTNFYLYYLGNTGSLSGFFSNSSITYNRKNCIIIHGVLSSPLSFDSLYSSIKSLNYYDNIIFYQYASGKSITSNAEKLKDLLLKYSAQYNPYGRGAIQKFDIICHSMGGLVSRHFIEKLNGSQYVRNLFMIGTPNNGGAYTELLNYIKYLPPIYQLETTIKNAFPGIYDLMNGKPFLNNLNSAGAYFSPQNVNYYSIAGDKDGLNNLNNTDGWVYVSSAAYLQNITNVRTWNGSWAHYKANPAENYNHSGLHTNSTINGVKDQIAEWLNISSAQGVVSGAIKNGADNSNLSGVTLKFYKSGILATTALTTSNGYYSRTLPTGNYEVTAEKTGYVTTSCEFTVEANVNKTVDIILLVSNSGGSNGNIAGIIKDATNNNSLSNVKVDLRSGVNASSSKSIIATAYTNSSGEYSFINLAVGTYTAYISKSGYITNKFTVVSIGGTTKTGQNGLLSPSLSTGEIRIVLEWGASPPDLDAHFTGPVSGSSDRFHIFYGNRGTTADAQYLDVDKQTGYGPETITSKTRIAGTYRYCVHDYDNKNISNSYALSNSGARVTVYRWNSATPLIYNIPANNSGTVWKVFELNGSTGAITTLNTFANESSPGNTASFAISQENKSDEFDIEVESLILKKLDNKK